MNILIKSNFAKFVIFLIASYFGFVGIGDFLLGYLACIGSGVTFESVVRLGAGTGSFGFCYLLILTLHKNG